jgi:hypothetical protein
VELKAKPKLKFQTADAWDVHVRGQIDGLNQAFRLACEGGSMPGHAISDSAGTSGHGIRCRMLCRAP